MNKEIVRALAEIEAISCKRNAMIALNESHANVGLPQAYDEQSFWALADEAEKIAQRTGVV